MTESLSSKEQRILRVMRKVLTNIIKDTTPRPGTVHVLSDRTIEDIRDCLGLISARERELTEARGLPLNEKPYYVDEAPSSHVIPLHKIGLKKRRDEEKK